VTNVTSTVPRPVRIARGRTAPEGERAAPAPSLDPYAPVSLPPHGNRGGLRRARRMLFLYLLALAILYGGVVLLVATSPYGAVRNDLPIYVALSAIASASALAGFVMTLGRAPFAVYVDRDDLVVRERFGSVRRFPLDATLKVSRQGHRAAGFLSPEPTETVRLSSARQKEREYVLEDGLLSSFPELQGRTAAR
jgi:hypothetical protein